jgi:hypothetical protein
MMPSRKILPIAFILVFSISCKKQSVICTGNCDAVNISGYLFDNVTNANAATIAPISLDWVKFSGIISTQNNVSSIKTKADGTFDASLNIDTTLFRQGYFLSLEVANNDSYITVPDNGGNTERMYTYDPNRFTNLRLDVYPKTNLKIELNRIQNDSFQYFQVAYYFVDNAYFFPFTIGSPQDINKTALDVPTSADLFTKIAVTKRNSAGVSTMTIDSIRCTKNGPNIYTFNY